MSFSKAGVALVGLLIPGVAAAQSPPPAAKPAVATITGMQAGDVACYLTLRDEAGATSDAMADFAICDKPSLVGRRVRLTWQMGNVQAPSCQGNPDCKQTVRVPLVVGAAP
jgi:hypothetical protein